MSNTEGYAAQAEIAEAWKDRPVVPAEGEGGVFTQSWFPICLASEVVPGEILGRDFLDGRVIVFRGSDGAPVVASAYCPHVGADLSVGEMIDGNVRCAFHHWEYNDQGRCVKTGLGDPPPRAACLFKFPSVEKFGIVWAFNGEEPLWHLPEPAKPESTLLTTPLVSDAYNCDGWIFAANTPDMQHIKVVHGVKFRHDDPHKEVDWCDWGFNYNITADHGQGPDIAWRVGIRGSSFYWQEGLVDGWWLGVYAGFTLERPGQHRVIGCIAVEKGDGSPASEQKARQTLDFGHNLLVNTAAEDSAILNTIHYRPRTLTAGDRTLSRYLKFLRDYPRAHPSAEFIR